MDSDSDNRLS
jgi:hypothetical protein